MYIYKNIYRREIKNAKDYYLIDYLLNSLLYKSKILLMIRTNKYNYKWHLYKRQKFHKNSGKNKIVVFYDNIFIVNLLKIYYIEKFN